MGRKKADQGTLEQVLADVVSTGDLSLYGIAADWLEEHGRGAEAELVRLTWLERRPEVEGRIQQLLASGVRPCVPRMVNSIGMELVWVPPGTFLMGSPPDEEERNEDEDQRGVEIAQGFWLGVHPVTQEQWQAIMGTNPSYFSRAGDGREDVLDIPDGDLRQFPVESVSWEDAQELVNKLNDREGDGGWLHRLPGEAEWEYACRGGASSYQVFHSGNSLSSSQANFDGGYPYGGAPQGPWLGRPSVVGSYSPNVWGLHDMHGNVWEWCQDWDMEGFHRVIRGGGWYDGGLACRAASRLGFGPVDRFLTLGVRLARAPR